jgi:hypothetical protein
MRAIFSSRAKYVSQSNEERRSSATHSAVDGGAKSKTIHMSQIMSFLLVMLLLDLQHERSQQTRNEPAKTKTHLPTHIIEIAAVLAL